MNKPSTPPASRASRTASTEERALIHYAAEALDSLVPAGWTVEISEDPRGKPGMPDAIISLTDAAGERVRLLVEAKSRPTPSALAAWADRAADRAPWLMVAPELSDRSKGVLRQAGINWVDASGSVSLRLPRVVVEIDSPEARRHTDRLTAVGRSLVMPYSIERVDDRFVSELFAGEALRIVRRLLLDPSRTWRVKEMAETTGVSKGWVSRVFATLERDAYLEGPSRGPRRVVDPEGLLDAWAETDSPPQPQLRAVTTESPGRLLERLSALPSDSYALTGDAAAELVAPFARVSQTELYVNPDLLRVDEALRSLRARETTRGANVIVLPVDDLGVLDGAETTDSPSGPLQVVSRPQLYVDLRRRGGPSREAGEFLKQREAIWPSNR